MVKNNRVGEVFYSTKYGKITIIEYYGFENCTIQFEDGTIIKNKIFDHVKRLIVKNPNFPSIYGIAYIGQGVYGASRDQVKNLFYNKFKNMIERSADKKLKEKFPAYKDVTVCVEWLNFQNFAKWMDENYNPETMEGWHLDKDILFKSNKIYSPDTCCFVPQEINALFTKGEKRRGRYPIGVSFNNGRGKKFKSCIEKYGKSLYLGLFDTEEEAFEAYKTAKEYHIKEVAEKWRSKITEKVYNALINYPVEITD